MIRNLFALFVVCFFYSKNTAQTDTTAHLTFSGYTEVYYLYDFNKPLNHERPEFLYNHKRHNEVNINLALAKLAYASQKTRANLAFMAGNYAQYNLEAEPLLARFVYEANAGIKLSNKHHLWLDAGIMPSHIGFESAIGADCWTLTRSMVAENSPYYEAGAKLSFSDKNQTFTVSALVLNGWQRIHRIEGYDKPAWGLQLNYKPNSQFTLNYSNFTGFENFSLPDDRRVYHNFYLIWEGDFGLSAIAGIDVGKQDELGKWYAPTLVLKWELTPKMKLSNRYEYFKDENHVVAYTIFSEKFDVFGVSLGCDYEVTKQALIRVEARHFQAKARIFEKRSDLLDTNFSAAAAICMKF
jgi:hypothetical protein